MRDGFNGLRMKQTKTTAWVCLFCLQPREVVFLVFRAKGNVIITLCMYVCMYVCIYVLELEVLHADRISFMFLTTTEPRARVFST